MSCWHAAYCASVLDCWTPGLDCCSAAAACCTAVCCLLKCWLLADCCRLLFALGTAMSICVNPSWTTMSICVNLSWTACCVVAFYMCDFSTIILYETMLNFWQFATEPDFTCWFGSFGKYRNRTERTDTELRRYRIFCGTDRYRFSLEPNLPRYRGTEPIGSVVPNAQSDWSDWSGDDN